MELNPIIEITNIKKNFYYQNELMIDVNIEYPQLTGLVPIRTAKIFNRFYFNETKNLLRYARKELYPAAVEQYKYNKEQGFPFNHYTLMRVFDITYNEKYIISLYADTYEYTGGAHGLTTRISNTWSLKEPKMLTLADVCGNDNYDEIIAEITRQALEKQETEPIFFDNLEENIIKNFDPNNFYLVPEGVVIYYPLYSIAPYASGIQEFLITDCTHLL